VAEYKLKDTVDPAKVAKAWRKCPGAGGHVWNRCTKHPHLYRRPTLVITEACPEHGGPPVTDDPRVSVRK
jgi:hypothetical protein